MTRDAGRFDAGGLRIAALPGEDLTAALPALARLRIEVFRAWPYLYAGDPAYEERYLAAYAATPGSVVVAAFDGDEIVGAATGLPLAAEPEDFCAPFVAHGYDVERIFYFGESVLRARYRGRGVGVAFFAAREAHARASGDFSHACFGGVVRADDDPRRPEGHTPLDAFWRKRGYAPVEGLVTPIAWREIGEDAETPKPLQIWMRAL